MARNNSENQPLVSHGGNAVNRQSSSIQSLILRTELIENQREQKSNRLPEFRRKRIHSREELKRGDHVAWHRMWGYWHHAIFLEKDQHNSARIRVYEHSWNSESNEVDFHLEYVDFCGCAEVVYRITYVDWSKDQEKTLKRADCLIREQREAWYDIFDNNCEHMVRYCKTGLYVSTQVEELTGPTGCAMLTLRSVLLLLMRLCGVLVLFTIEAVWPDEPEDKTMTTISSDKETVPYSIYNNENREPILAVVYTIFNGLAFMVYQLYVKCKEIKEIDEPDKPDMQLGQSDISEKNVCYKCCMRCYLRTYGPRCTDRGMKCYNRRPRLPCDKCTQCWWCCCMCCCRTPCINAKKIANDPTYPRNPGCCVIKTSECCKLYAGDVLMIIFREVACVSFPLGVMLSVHYWLEGYNDLEKAGIGLGISLGGILFIYGLVYCLIHGCRCCLLCSFRCVVKRCCCCRNTTRPHEPHLQV